MKKNLITILVNQHGVLKKEVGAVAKLCEAKQLDGQKIDKLLKKFARDLQDHLDLENNTFYNQLLKAMADKGLNIKKTQEFIREMKDIEKVVLVFLKKFSQPEAISKNSKSFVKEFQDIASALALRIEAEEAGVYSYWNLF